MPLALYSYSLYLACSLLPKFFTDQFILVRENHEAVEEKEERIRESVTERDTEALLLHDVLFNGILAIGTFGHRYPLLAPEEEMKLDQEEKGSGAENYHEVPGATVLVVAANKPPAASFNMKSPTDGKEMLTEVVVLRAEAGEDATKLQEKPLLETEEEVAAEKPRTTLADLFAADALFVDGPARESVNGDDDDDSPEGISKDACCADKKQSKKKEEKPLQAASSTKRKLQRVMRKMMRKKIHPEQLNGGRSLKGIPMMVRGDENVGHGISAGTN
ncbi:uncharacterized protein LOC109728829 isoform X2 [Ananas comosus]|uniref:Protein TILLER ANGLE CONTROL 1 n=1 Tax=Ananas comosus TaxID=4615 RepID=A0A6P5H6N4_ANACO|nr:uncharacterized protein LOC109728829 isoform X2 [Ananas comosus]